ncbi:Phosphate acetyltransferase [Sulfurimonas gotlandica GD1]|uniref:Phosphate acetyltransferase n=1 Tax=Sulfurimonas gotlandica (strain DSM 19862 / JCM 16533 / GD1) TaxID=929558 RepID=B6BKP6_SULGG|nr:phosphate acetyltransferase [Sulfurimonas gotlandica]EDZ62413.1 phosphate acetyltransferase [Sulfurimonas gotlandica GD1]EHP29105.1 Phosphate acetyltransferase [Sulfurimonas gotlandica GD1]
MKIKSLYISAQEKNAGTLFISMGMMEILKRNMPHVAFFRPVIYSKHIEDGDINFMLNRYNLEMDYKDCYGFDIEYVENMIANNKTDQLMNEFITKFKKLEDKYDFVLVEGIRHSFLTSTINFDLNIKIAQNFGSPIINIVNAKNKTIADIHDDILIENENSTFQGCTHFATFINRLDDKQDEALKKKLNDYPLKIYFLKEVDELGMLSIADVIDSLDAIPIFLQPKDITRIVRGIKVAALTLNNFLDHVEEDDLVVVPADRSDIILGLFGALYSKNYPNISGIVFPFGMEAHPNIKKLIDGLNSFSIPILSVDDDTYMTANKLSKAQARLRVTSERKIALALGLFNSSVDIEAIEKKIATVVSTVLTPMMFEYKLFERARLNKKRIVLPESNDERILRAAEIILRREVADITLLGNSEKITETYLRLGLDLSKATIIDHHTSNLRKEFAEIFYEMRKEKGLTLQAAEDAMTHGNYFATMMVHLGHVDGMVSGAIGSTGETIRPALQIIKTKPNISIVSSVFFMCLKKEVLVYGDCAVNQDPNAEELAQIAISSAETAQAFGLEAKIAMLSYSTGESGSGIDVDKVREATKIVKNKKPNLLIDGPIQYDAAVNKKVASTKLPDSKVAGEATVLIFPDLNTGNNTYKAVQRSSGAVAIGPILQGLKKPINDLSRGCSVSDIVNTVAITAIQAGQD